MPTPEPIRWGFDWCAKCGLVHCSHPKPAPAGDDQKQLLLQRAEAKLFEAVDTFVAAWMDYRAVREG